MAPPNVDALQNELEGYVNNFESVSETKKRNFLTKNIAKTAVKEKEDHKIQKDGWFEQPLVWRNVIIAIILHLGALYGGYLIISKKLYSLFALAFFMGCLTNFSVIAGAHRLWSHKSYKAKWPLRLIFMLLQTVAGQNSIYEWVRDHRGHHKFVDTTADIHNSNRGFWFSHLGWVIIRKHPDVIEKGKTIDLSDIEADPIVMFQKKYHLRMMPFFILVIPTFIASFFFGHSLYDSFFICGCGRYITTLHITFTINSFAHLWGPRPYDKSIKPRENFLVKLVTGGEGYHNYHHVFPWDYKAAEFKNFLFNSTTTFIDLFAKIGWVYDQKTVSEDMIRKRITRTGDGSRKVSIENEKVEDLINELDHSKEEKQIWGWDDKDLSEEDREEATIINRHAL